ncbi:conjugal transfer protein TraD [Flavobacterium sp. GSA192]|uniref:conjugal transfer protein TraD n=1 Tax=Flavobacterium sp. GSA192 TaxID=2576304 RepID=UPI00112BBF25|nr:conjugal transfer protein TraD [Flavobacterium sp. GSA192]
MEIVIVICLLIVIALLLQDKIVIKIGVEQKPTKKKQKPKLADIMGQSKTLRSLSVSNNANESQKKKQEDKTDNFDIEIDDQDNESQIPQEELDEVFRNISDFEDEAEEWNSYGISNVDNGFAQGVTFEELSSVGMLLQKDNLEPSQKEKAIGIVQKIQGTELFDLLENSMESASRKIAELLDSSLSFETESSSSILRKNDFEDFDIGEFV